MKINMIEEIKRYSADMFTLFLAFISPIVGVMAAMFTFVILDLVTGILKARKKAEKKVKEQKDDLNSKEIVEKKREAVKSRQMSHSLAKFIFYFSGIILAHITNHFLELEMPLVKMVLGFIILVELKSIDENMKVVLGYSMFGKILDAIKRRDSEDEEKD